MYLIEFHQIRLSTQTALNYIENRDLFLRNFSSIDINRQQSSSVFSDVIRNHKGRNGIHQTSFKGPETNKCNYPKMLKMYSYIKEILARGQSVSSRPFTLAFHGKL